MKILLVTIAVLAVIALAGCGFKNGSNSHDAPTGRLVRFEFSEHGTMAQPNKFYRLKLDTANHVWLMVYTDKLEVDSTVLTEVERMIVEQGIYKYEEHYEPKMEVMDGEGWAFGATYDNGERLSSSGDNAWPQNFSILNICHYLDSVMAAGGDRIVRGDSITYDYDF